MGQLQSAWCARMRSWIQIPHAYIKRQAWHQHLQSQHWGLGVWAQRQEHTCYSLTRQPSYIRDIMVQWETESQNQRRLRIPHVSPWIPHAQLCTHIHTQSHANPHMSMHMHQRGERGRNRGTCVHRRKRTVHRGQHQPRLHITLGIWKQTSCGYGKTTSKRLGLQKMTRSTLPSGVGESWC